ncbi:MAG: hypothetical protein NTY01_25050 [Verrucomicrobia bacterium]|nr:hypothetical protein [Verrucomicrobiota bacterium]
MQKPPTNVKLGKTELEIIEMFFAWVIRETSKRPVVKKISSIRNLESLLEPRKILADHLRTQTQTHSDQVKEALEDFITKNKTDVKLVFPAAGLKNADILPDVVWKDMIAALCDGGGDWQVFFHHYPNAAVLFTVSRVGFDHTGTVAIIYLEEAYCRFRTDGGGLLVVKCEGNKWIYQTTITSYWTM